MYSRSYSQIDRRIFMKTKSKLLLIAALFSAFVFAFGGLSLSVYAAEENVNGWVATAPSGAAANYGSNIGWVQAPTAGENGFTNWCFNNNQTVANETALDITKPISLTYSCKSNVSNDGGTFVMFGLATSFEGATKMTAGFQEDVNAQYRPFHYAHYMKDNKDTAYIGIAGEPIQVDKNLYKKLTNRCGANFDKNWNANLEIYLGAEKATDGYILIDGLYVGYPKVTQASYPEGKAYLVVSSWLSGFFRMKVENKAEVTDVKDFSITSKLTGGKVVLQNNKLWRASKGETVSFTVTNVKAGYRVATVKYNGIAITADENGVYSFTMPGKNTTIAVTLEEIPDTFKVTSSSKYAELVFTNGSDNYEKGATVSFKLKLNGAYTLNSVKIGEETLTADENGVYTFTMPESNVSVSVDATKNYSKPSDKVVADAVNGWTTEIVTAEDGAYYGPLSDANGSTMVNETKGYSNFVLNNSGSISSVVGFDVSKPIYLDFLVKPNGDIPGNIGWFMMGLYDDWNILTEAGVDAYGGNGLKPDLNKKINEYLKLRIGFDYNDINSAMGFVSRGVTLAEDFTATNKFGSAWDWSDAKRGTDFNYAKIEFFIGETAEEGYIKIDGVKFATPTVKRSDFHDGIAYVHFMSFYSSRIQVKAYAPAQIDTESVDSRATLTFAEGTDVNALNTFDEVTFKVNVPENFGALVCLNGEELHADENGNYTAVLGYGKNALSVSIDELVKVSFNAGAYGNVDGVTITKGGTVSAPEITRNGYTLAWYADAAFATEFDFTAGISESCTVYAKWTPIEYTISYYDGANKIRDLMPSSYNVESDNIALPAPAKEGYTFEGWYTDAAFTGNAVTSIEKRTTGNLTLYAKYREGTEKESCISSVGTEFAFMAVALYIVSAACVTIKKRGARR